MYGEYATLEEQRRRAGLPPSDAAAATPMATHAPQQGPGAEQGPAPQAAAARATPGPANRVATIALLAYGLLTVIWNVPGYFDLATGLGESIKILGVDAEFTNFAQARLWGAVAAVILVLGWVVTAVLSVGRLRRGRRSWWVPLVGGAVTLLLVSVCAMIPLLGDAALMSALAGLPGR